MDRRLRRREQRLLAVDRVIDVAGGVWGRSDSPTSISAVVLRSSAGGSAQSIGVVGSPSPGSAPCSSRSNVGVTTLVAQIGIDNTASVRVAERVGFMLLRAGSEVEPHLYVHR